MIIVTKVSELKDILKGFNDYSLDIRIMERKSDEELKNTSYPFLWNMITGNLEFHDIGYSDKVVCFGVYENSENSITSVLELNEILNKVDDDFTIEISLMKEISEEELKGMTYPYPWNKIEAKLEFADISVGNKELCFNIRSKE